MFSQHEFGYSDTRTITGLEQLKFTNTLRQQNWCGTKLADISNNPNKEISFIYILNASFVLGTTLDTAILMPERHWIES